LSAGACVFCGAGGGGGVCGAARNIGATQNSTMAAEQPRIDSGCFSNFGNFPDETEFDEDGREGIGHHPFQIAAYASY
jgi:hypothetical protein